MVESVPDMIRYPAITMLILSREIGQGIVIEDVLVEVVRITPRFADVSLQKLTGGKKTIATLPLKEYVDVCYDRQFFLVQSRGSKIRLGIEANNSTQIHRKEVWDSMQ